MDVHDQGPDALFRASVQAFYEGRFAEGRLACDRLLNLPGLDRARRGRTRLNQVHYAPLLGELAPGLRDVPLEPPVREGWSRFNPTLVDDGDGWLVLLRSSNYRLTPPATYDFTDGDAIRTRYLLLRLDDALAPVGEAREVEDRTDAGRKVGGPVRDFEDCRLVRVGDRLHATATTREHNPSATAQIALLDLDPEIPAFERVRLLSPGIPGLHEKNWMPLGGDTLRLVYGLGPAAVLGCDPATGALALEALHEAPLAMADQRGGSQVVALDDGFLCLVHEVVWWEDASRTYLHRFVRLGPDLRVTGYSHVFRFRLTGIEFAAGLARRGDTLALTYGVVDREAWVATLPLAEALATVRPLDEMLGEAHSVRIPVPPGLEAVLEHVDGVPLRPAAPSEAPADPGAAPGGPPWVVSVTLAGDNEAIVADALRSVVDRVDACLVVDTGITDRTLEVAREVAGAKLVVRSFPWVEDFAAARNAALAEAAALGGSWALTVDTDERVLLGDTDLRAALAAATDDTLMVWHEGGSYRKERLFRLPAHGRYEGPTHEAFVGWGTRGTLEGIAFAELPKSVEAYRRKFERDAAILARHVAAHPDDPRWWYYLCDALANLGRQREAIDAFERCWALDGWEEEGAWAMYRMAGCWLALDETRRAEEACAAGLARHAGIAELAWLAGYAAWRGGRHRQAVRWSLTAAHLGGTGDRGLVEERHGFRHPPALWEGPWDVLRHALAALGDAAGAEEADRRFAAALAHRERLQAEAVRTGPRPPADGEAAPEAVPA